MTAGRYILEKGASTLLANEKWKAKVVENRAVFTVPTAATVGMSFVVHDGKYGAWPGGNAAPVIALGFKGKPTGGVFDKSVPLQDQQPANWCWAGTTKSMVTLNIRSERMVVEVQEDFENPKQAVYWAAPTVKTWQNKLNMHFGMGTQDVPVCHKPAS